MLQDVLPFEGDKCAIEYIYTHHILCLLFSPGEKNLCLDFKYYVCFIGPDPVHYSRVLIFSLATPLLFPCRSSAWCVADTR